MEMVIRVTEIYVEDALAELKKILLYKADALNDAAGMSIAAAFIGTSLQDGEPAFASIDPQRVNLKRFPITNTFIDALTFTIHPYSRTLMKGEDVKKLKSFMREAPHVGVFFGRHPLQRFEGLCRTIADAAYARWKLESDRRSYFSVREVALLAETNESVVREASTRKNGSRLMAFPGPNSVQIEHAEAKRWLSKQPRFRSSGLLPSSNLDPRQKLALVAGVEPGATMQQRARP